MSNRKVLIITYYWPPSGGVGVQRWLNYALELKKMGWEPIIYTPENPQFEIKDDSQLEKVKGLRVIKTKIWEPFNLFHKITGNKNRKNVQQGLVMEKTKKSLKDKLIVWTRGNMIVPDPRKFWVKSSLDFLKKFIQEEEIKTIITTGPPHSMHLIGLGLKRKIDIKWIADFRDPWSKWDVLDKLKVNAYTRRKHRSLELKVLTKADKIITVSHHLQASLSELGGQNKVELLYNGVSVIPGTSKTAGDKFVIGYYGMLNEMRNPSELWKVLDEMAADMPLELRLGGIVSESIIEEIKDLEHLAPVTEFLGYLPHDIVQQEYAKCDLLLLLLNRTENAKWILPVKFFEYIAASRSILALGPTASDLADIATDLRTFRMIDYSNVFGIKESMVFFKNNHLDFSSTAALLDQFVHANLAKQLAGILEALNEQD
jgi:glycosyltransferase involved in cell wall biosynthesis